MTRTTSLIPTTWILLLPMVLLGTWLLALQAEEKKGEPAKIAGNWDSNWGLVTLQTKPIKGKKLVSITGSYASAPDQKAIIKAGTFDPSTGVLKFVFEEPFRGANSHGKAQLTLAPDGNHFKGSYDQGGEHGDWNMTRVRSANFRSGMDFIFSDAKKQKNEPGAAVLAIDHGKVVYEKCYGLARLKDKKPITPHTTFELASCTKQFTGAAIFAPLRTGQTGTRR